MDNQLNLSETKIRELWSKGIVPDTLYVCFALEITANDPVFNSVEFARQWSIEKDDLTELQLETGWKPKTLKSKSVLAAICLLEEKGLAQTSISVQISQLDFLS
jgi:hypothetical protein